MKALCGRDSYASITIENFGKEFMLTPLTRVNAIITDENSTGAYTDNMGNFKAAVTGDDFQLNRKNRDPITISFRGVIVECVNDLPRSNDRSDSFYRRQLFIPFVKCFNSCERKYIKHDFLHRKEVLEYALYKVLHMDYNSFTEPQACKDLLEEYKIINDPIRQFYNEIVPELVWDFLPNQFLYDLYKNWFKKNNPSGSVQGKTTFLKGLHELMDHEWEYVVSKPPKDRMDKTEYLIFEYGLVAWYNPTYKGEDPDKICQPVRKSTYSGYFRKTQSAGSNTDNHSD